MTLGICLLLIFVLYLVDKHNRWRQFVKVVIGLVIIGVLSVGGFFGWTKYEDYKANKASEAYRIQMQPFWDCISRNSQFSNAEEECKKNPAVVLTPITIKPDPGPWVDYLPKPKTRPALGWAVVSLEYGDATIRKRCAFNTGIVPCYGEEESVATLHKGDRVQLLSHKMRAPNGSEICEVRFQQWTGWINAEAITPE